EAIAREVRNHINVESGRLLPGWASIDSAKQRRRVVPTGHVVWDRCCELILAEYSQLNTSLARRGCSKLGKAAMRSKLIAILPAVIAHGTSQRLVDINPFPAAWTTLADGIAKELNDRETARIKDPEWLILNYLLLAAFFRSCNLETAGQVAQVLGEPRE